MLLNRAAGDNWEQILFSVEKLFTIKQAYNPQNDKVCSHVPLEDPRQVECRQNPSSLMVWAGFFATGKTPLVLLIKGLN